MATVVDVVKDCDLLVLDSLGAEIIFGLHNERKGVRLNADLPDLLVRCELIAKKYVLFDRLIEKQRLLHNDG